MNVNYRKLTVNFREIIFSLICGTLAGIYVLKTSLVNANYRELTVNFREIIFSLICGTFAVIRVLNIIILEQYSYCGQSNDIHLSFYHSNNAHIQGYLNQS